jgi:hypothetical protein
MEGLNTFRERRQDPRFSVQLPLDYWETPEVVRGGLVADISAAGLRIHSVHRIETGAELKIRVYVSKEEYTFGSIEGRGKIIWRTLHREGDWKGYACGLYLTEMAFDDRERLKQLLTHQREDQEDPLKNA